MVKRLESKHRRQWHAKVGYITETTRPLNCLVFLLPIIVLHQVGVLLFAIYSPGGQPLINAAFGMLTPPINCIRSNS